MKEKYGVGVVPSLLTELIAARKKTRLQIAENEVLVKILVSQLLYIIHVFCPDQTCLDTIHTYLNTLTHIPEVFDEFNKVKLDNSLLCTFLTKPFDDEYKESETLMQVRQSFWNYISSDIDVTKNTEKQMEKLVYEIYEKCKTTMEYNIVLDKRQASFKICANSMYGAMGVKFGFLPLQPAAMTITFKGRSSIEKISTYIPEKFGGKTVYGDTDSSMIYFHHIKTNEEAVELAETITQEMQQFFKAPMKLEFEKIYEKYLILSKKRYIAQVANKQGKIIGFVKKGVVLKRRDNCKVLRDIYLQTCTSILDNIDKQTILSNVVEFVNRMFQRQFSHQLFTITKSLSKDIEEYNLDKKLPSHVQLAKRMRQRGQHAETGTRIEFLFTTFGKMDPKPDQGNKVESVEYFEKWKSILRVDFLYYLDKQMVNPVDELLSVGIKEFNFMKRLNLVHQQYLCVNQHILSMSSIIDFQHPSKQGSTQQNDNAKKITKPLKAVDNDIIYLSKINSKKMWEFEEKFIKENIHRYTSKSIQLLKKIRGIVETSTSSKTSNIKLKKQKYDKCLQLDNSQIPITYYISQPAL